MADAILKAWGQGHMNQQTIDRHVIEQRRCRDAVGDAGRHGHVPHSRVELVVVVLIHMAVRCGAKDDADRSRTALWSRRRFEQILPQPHASPADTGEHRAQGNALQVGGLLMGKAADDHQQQRLAEFLGQSVERPLHRGGEFVVERIPASRCHRVRKLTAARRNPGPRPPPVIGGPTAKDCQQPGPLAASGIVEMATRPGRAKGILHDVFGIVRITQQAKGDTIESLHMVAHPPIKPVTGGRGFGHVAFARTPGTYFPGARRTAAAEAASQKGSWPAGGSLTTRADLTPGQARTAATASGDGS